MAALNAWSNEGFWVFSPDMNEVVVEGDEPASV